MTVKPMKEYFRKPYLVEDKSESEEAEYSDYRYMMDTDWQGLQNSSYIVVQSVRKKPYATDDYQEMEQKADGYTNIDWELNWKWVTPKFNWGFNWDTGNTTGAASTVSPFPPSRTINELKWIQCVDTASSSMSYLVIVRDSYVKTGSKISSIPSNLYLEKATPDATGLSITRIWQRGGMTYAILSTAPTIAGEYYITASDGDNYITKRVSCSSEWHYAFKGWIGATPYWVLLDDNLNPTSSQAYSEPNASYNVYATSASANLYFVEVHPNVTSYAKNGSTRLTDIYAYEDSVGGYYVIGYWGPAGWNSNMNPVVLDDTHYAYGLSYQTFSGGSMVDENVKMYLFGSVIAESNYSTNSGTAMVSPVIMGSFPKANPATIWTEYRLYNYDKAGSSPADYYFKLINYDTGATIYSSSSASISGTYGAITYYKKFLYYVKKV